LTSEKKKSREAVPLSKFTALHEVFGKKRKPLLNGLDPAYDGIYSVIHAGRVLIFYSNTALRKVGIENISEGLRLI
jgi:hypothetical protein